MLLTVTTGMEADFNTKPKLGISACLLGQKVRAVSNRMPRGQQAGFVYHVIDQGNGRSTIFHKAQDYQAFLSSLHWPRRATQ